MTVNQLNAQMTFTFYYSPITFGQGWGGVSSLAFKVEKKNLNSVDYIVTGNYSARYIF